MSNLTIEDVVAAFLKLRRKKERIEREAKEKTAAIALQMEQIEAFLLTKMQEDGVSSYKTSHGTAYRTTTDYANVANWEDLLDYIRDNDAYDLLDKRVNKSAVRSLIGEEKPVPPGVNYGTKTDIAIRKPTH